MRPIFGWAVAVSMQVIKGEIMQHAFTPGMLVRDICPTRAPEERFGVGTVEIIEIEDESTMVPTLHVWWVGASGMVAHGPCDIEPIAH